MEILAAKFVVGEKHTTTEKMEAKTNKGEKGIYFVHINDTKTGEQQVNKIVIN